MSCLLFGQKLESEGAKCELSDIGEQTFPDGTKLPLPPVLLAELGSDPKKKTLCVYGHLDVQPAAKEDGWDTEPFVLTEKDGKLFGRGSTDDKGPVLGWLHIIQAFHKLKIDLPVNFKVSFQYTVVFSCLSFFSDLFHLFSELFHIFQMYFILSQM